jgi:hypothetical protein
MAATMVNYSAAGTTMAEPTSKDLVSRYFGGFATGNPEHLENAAQLIQYFGPPAGGLDMVARDSRMMDRFQLPYAYLNKSTYLADVIIGLLIDTQLWAYSEPDGLPLTMTDSQKIQWDVWKFEEGYLEREPEEGTARVMSSGVEHNQATTLRRSKAIEVEHGFWQTQMGQRHYARQIQQLVDAFGNTLGLDALVAFVSAREDDVRWMVSNVYPDKLDSDLLKIQARQFGAWQKMAYAPEATVRECTEILEARPTSRAPKMMICSRGCQTLMRGATNSAKLDANVVGGAVAERRMAQDPQSITTFAGLRVHFTKPYKNIIGGQLPTDPLTRKRVFGESFQMRPYSVGYHERKLAEGKLVSSSARDVEIMDYQLDRPRRIALKTAIDNLPWQANGYLAGHDPTAPGADGAGLLGGKRTDPHVRSPLECMGYRGVEECLVWGQIPLEFLSERVLSLIVKQLIHANAQNIVANVLAVNSVFARTRDAAAANRANATVMSTKTYYSANLSGHIAYGQFLGSSASTASASTAAPLSTINLEDIHQRNLAQFSTYASDLGDVYKALLNQEKNEKEKENLIRRTDSIFSSGVKEVIQEQLLDPLTKHTQGQTKTERQEAKTKLFSFVPQVASSLKPDVVMQEGVPTLFSKTEVDERVAKGEKFQFIDPITNKETSPNFYNAEKAADLLTLHYAAGLKQDVTATNPKIVAGTTVEWQKVNLTDFDYRMQQCSLTDPVEIDLYKRVLCLPFHKSVFDGFIDKNIFLPFVPVICRPWVQMETSMAIIGTGGRALGATYVNNPDVMMQDDATAKRHSAHFTVNTKAVVHDSSLITLRDDVVIKNYVGMGNTRFMTLSEVEILKANNWRIPENDNMGAMFVVLAPFLEDGPLPYVWHLSGRLDNSDPASHPDIYYEPTPISALINHAPLGDQHPLSWETARYNRVMFQATQWCVNPETMLMTAVITNKDCHMGQNVYGGMMHDLKSLNLVLKECDYDNRLVYQDALTI